MCSPGLPTPCPRRAGESELLRPLPLQVSPEEAKEHWESNYLFSLTKCNHAIW